MPYVAETTLLQLKHTLVYGCTQILCSAVAVALHYLFLASFMWMLMEGVVLYVLLVVVFIRGKERKYMALFTILGYGEQWPHISSRELVLPACMMYQVCQRFMLLLWLPWVISLVMSGVMEASLSKFTCCKLNASTHGSNSSCWLKYETHFIWSFIVPVIVILLV